MSSIAIEAARLMDVLPEADKAFAYEFIKKLDKGELKSVEMDVDRLILTPKSKEELKVYKQKVVKEKARKEAAKKKTENNSVETKEDIEEKANPEV